MTPDPELLGAAVTRNDAPGVRELLRDATEADRRACAKTLRPVLHGPELVMPEPIMVRGMGDLMTVVFARMTGHDHDRGERSAHEQERDEWNRMRQGAAFLAAALGLAGGVAAAVRAMQDYPAWAGRLTEEDIDAVAGVLADRHPVWLADFVDRHLGDQSDRGLASWPLARRLVRLGAIGRPTIPEYTTKFPAGFRRGTWDGSGRWRQTLTVHDGLLADRGLLEDEVWRLFTVPGAAWGLGEEWADALVRLAAEKHLDRDRLIDATLDAFTRDFAPNRVGWYATFHDQLIPSAAEMAARAGKYLALLAVNCKPAVMLAQRAAGKLLDAELLDTRRFLEASAPALTFPQKSVAVAQLKLIGKVAAGQPGVRGPAMATAAQAFAHQRDDVQEAALALIRRHGVPDGPDLAAIRELAAALSPGLTGEAAALDLAPAAGPALGAPDAELDELERRISALPATLAAGPRAALAAARGGEVPGPARSGPSAGRPLPPPLEDPEELVQLLAQLMEDASDPLAVERAMAGAVRLAALPAHDRARIAGPLLKRAGKRARDDYDGPFSGYEITADMACLVLAWGSGWSVDADPVWISGIHARPEAVRRDGEASTMAGLLSARAREASRLITSGRCAALLAEPEFERGAISHGRLLERLASRSACFTAARPPRYDLEVALLRLAPGADDSFWSAWARLHPASADAARRAYTAGLAALSFELVVGVPPSRFPHHHVRPWPHVLARITRPPAVRTGSRSWRLLTGLSSPLRDYISEYGQRYEHAHYDAVVAAWPLLCPWQPELAAAHLLRALSDGLKPGPSPATTAADCLASPAHPLGFIGHLALVTALASGEADTRIAAAEVWSRASQDGRLDPVLAASALVAGVTGEAFKLSRIADGLRHASPEPIAGYRITETVFGAAAALIAAKPANLHLLFELAARTGARSGLPGLPGAVAGLAGQQASSRLVAAARRLASGAGGGPAPERGQAIVQALTALATRAEGCQPPAMAP